MTPPNVELRASYGGRDPREFPAYSVREIARYLHLPDATLRSWVAGRPYSASGEERWFEALIPPAQADPLRLSFLNLAEAFVLSAIRRQHGVSMPRVREALAFVEKKLRVRRPLATQKFQTDGVDLFVDHAGLLISASRGGQLAIPALMRERLKRIEFDGTGLAAKLYPLSRTGTDVEQPRHIIIDPLLAYGRPAIAGRGVPTAIVAERFFAGEDAASLATDYGCTREQIDEAIRCERAAA